jgi:hypothetical protein
MSGIGITLTELRHRGEFLVSCAEGHLSIDRGVVENNTGQLMQLQAGTVMAKQIDGSWAPLVRAGVVGSLMSTTILAAGAGFAAIPAVSAESGNGGVFVPTMTAVTVQPAGGNITGTYQPNDLVTLAGGQTPVKLAVTTTSLAAAGSSAPGTAYAPGDTITPAGGTQIAAPQLTVTTTKVVGATIVAPGNGGTNGAATVTGTTGTGVKFQASVTIANGAISAVNAITLAGSYTVNPAAPADEPVTGGNLNGAALNVVMGVAAVAVSNGGVFTANAAAFTQAATSGNGIGATFSNLLFAPNAVTLVSGGAYTVLPATPIAQAATTGQGAGAVFTASWGVLSVSATGGANYDPGDPLVFAGGNPTQPAGGFINVSTAGDLRAAGILYDTLYILAGQTVTSSAFVVRLAEVNGSELTWDASMGPEDIAAALAQLRDLGIVAR